MSRHCSPPLYAAASCMSSFPPGTTARGTQLSNQGTYDLTAYFQRHNPTAWSGIALRESGKRPAVDRMSAFRLASDFNEAGRIPERQIGSCFPALCTATPPEPCFYYIDKGASRHRSGGDDSKEAGLRRRPSLLANCDMAL